MKHHKTLIANLPTCCQIGKISATSDNLKCAYTIFNNNSNNENDTLYSAVAMGDKLYGITSRPFSNIKHIAISFDGSKVGYAIQRSSKCFSVYINDQLLEKIELDDITGIGWLDNENLYVYGLMNNTIRYYLNGNNTNNIQIFDSICIEPFGTLIILNGKPYFINNRGEKTIAPNQYSDPKYAQNAIIDQLRNQQPACRIILGRKTCVEYGGCRGEFFEDINEENGGEGFQYNANKMRTAYIGTRATTASRLITQAMNQITTNSYISKALVALHDPYLGPLHYLYRQATKRYYVVDHPRIWKKPYKGIIRLFYTPKGQLIAHVVDRNRECVVVDEVRGPWVEALSHLKLIEDEITYLIVEKHRLFRVSILERIYPD